MKGAEIGSVAQRDTYLGIYVHWGSAPCSKNIGDQPIKWLLLKKKKKKRTFGSID
jgi:hypothetical protein